MRHMRHDMIWDKRYSEYDTWDIVHMRPEIQWIWDLRHSRYERHSKTERWDIVNMRDEI